MSRSAAPWVEGRKDMTFSKNLCVPLILVGAAWLWPGKSWAEEDAAAARVLFQEARTLADAGDYPAACPKFIDSYRLEAAIGTLLNMADCERRQGQLARAWVSFQKALEQLPKSDVRRAAVETVASDLGKRLPRLSIRLDPS